MTNAVKGTSTTDDAYDWFYGTKTNQFWAIFERVYGTELKSKIAKQEILAKLGIAMADIIYQCERKEDNNLDSNLINIVYNIDAITGVLGKNKIKKNFFSSRFVENKFRMVFKGLINRYPTIELVTLPSPSPRYAQLSKEQKINKYKELLPKI